MKTLDEFVMVRSDVITPELGRALLDEYTDSDAWLQAQLSQEHPQYADYPASAIPVTHPEITKNSPAKKQLSLDIVASIRAAFDQYHAKFSRRDQGINFLHIEKLVGLRLIRYETGQHMANHTDKFPDAETGKALWPAVTFTINVNDDYEGGELDLMDGDILFDGKAGEGIIFPANFMFPHAIKPVTSGTRYSLAGWFM